MIDGTTTLLEKCHIARKKYSDDYIDLRTQYGKLSSVYQQLCHKDPVLFKLAYNGFVGNK